MNRMTKQAMVNYLYWITAIYLIILKCIGTITWPWWLVLAPIWFPIAFSVAIILLFLGFIGLTGLIVLLITATSIIQNSDKILNAAAKELKDEDE